MPDILFDFPIRASSARVFQAVAEPVGLDQWWTLRSSGSPAVGEDYVLDFGPEYVWRAKVLRVVPDCSFELLVTHADNDWTGTRVGFDFDALEEMTWVRFHHTGWTVANDHFRITSFCWAMYLRILKRYVEIGEIVAYENRLDV